MDTTTYTVIKKDGEVIGRGLSAIEAMVEIIGYDSCSWAVRAEDTVGDETRFVLYTAGYRDYRMIPTVVAVWAKSEAEAMPGIADEVIRQCSGWRESPDCFTDAEYDAISLGALGDDELEG